MEAEKELEIERARQKRKAAAKKKRQPATGNTAKIARKQRAIEDKLRAKLAAIGGSLGSVAGATTSAVADNGKGKGKGTGGAICYLCRKKFKSEAMLLRHNAESALHKENLRKKKLAKS